MHLTKLDPNRYIIEKRGNMKADVIVYLNDSLIQHVEDEQNCLQQLIDAAHLPGVCSPVLGMPDIHTGFGLPIGGVMAVCAREGVVSAGAVGMDINCGVRLLRTSVPLSETTSRTVSALLQEVYSRVPSGLGKKSRDKQIRKMGLKRIAESGAREIVKTLGMGTALDLEHTEEGGCLEGGDLAAVSQAAVRRGDQMGTIGSGNHFVEIGFVSKVYDTVLAQKFGLEEDTLTVMIHTGSRGFGHQICTDYSSLMTSHLQKTGGVLPNKGLSYAPIASELGKQYLSAMAVAANFAFANRQLVTEYVRSAFSRVFGTSWDKLGLDVVYDVAHNIAKFEEIHGKKVLVHRKGATRALPKGHPLNGKKFMSSGHPVAVPGTMGTASYVLVGLDGVSETFNSINHGAGRVLSRNRARRTISLQDFDDTMQGVLLLHRGGRILDEAPAAYKDIHAVVDALVEAGITKKVIQLKPLAVLKGED